MSRRGIRRVCEGIDMRLLRLVPDNTNIKFMRGRFAGVITSAVLSTLSVILFFYPGLNLGVDFRGGVVAELRTPAPTPPETIRKALEPLGFGDIRVQQFASPIELLVRFDAQAQPDNAQRRLTEQIAHTLPGTQ